MIVISDTHGCYKTLLALLKKLPHDNICFVGDLIDRGPKSREVVSLVKDKYKTVKGNHEQMCIDHYKNESLYSAYTLWTSNGGDATLQSYEGYEDILKEHIEWFKDLPLYIEYTNKKGQSYIISHSNINFVWHKRETDPEEFEEWCLWSRYFDKTNGYRNMIGDSINLVGHTPQKYVSEVEELIFIDTGCVYKGYEGYGKLTAYDLETGEIYQQENIE